MDSSLRLHENRNSYDRATSPQSDAMHIDEKVIERAREVMESYEEAMNKIRWFRIEGLSPYACQMTMREASRLFEQARRRRIGWN